MDQTQLETLIELGEEQGYLTKEDIEEELPAAADDSELLSQVGEALKAEGITVVDTIIHRNGKGARKAGKPKKTSDHIDLYLHEAGDIPLLSRDEEAALAQLIEKGRKASEVLANGDVGPKKRRALQAAVDRGMAAREHLILANLRLVISIAKRYTGRGLTFLDLIQEGNVGLMRAIKKFDYTKGYKFSTYATWWIRQAITRSLSNKSRTIRLPVHVIEQLSKLRRESQRLSQELGREATDEELAEILEVSPERIKLLQTYQVEPMTLDGPVDDDEELDLAAAIPDEETPMPDEISEEHSVKEQIQSALELLPVRNARVMRLRFGFSDGIPRSLAAIGRSMGITRERVRQVERESLETLRKLDVAHHLEAYIN